MFKLYAEEMLASSCNRSHRGVVDKPFALESRGLRFDHRFHQSVRWDFKPWPCLHMT